MQTYTRNTRERRLGTNFSGDEICLPPESRESAGVPRGLDHDFVVTEGDTNLQMLLSTVRVEL